jgi:type II secretory pathway predicted ATPase ExeA
MSTPPNYLTYFGLREAPFSKDVGDADLWLPPSRQAVCDELIDAVSEHDSVLLTGDPGVGKTCLLRALRHRVPEAGCRLTYCHNATLGRRDFYRQLCLALGLAPAATAASVFWAVSCHVQDLGREKLHPVFLLDEAHLLHQDTLDHLHILLNYEWDRRPLLSLVLVGLPELENRLAIRHNRSLYSRLHRRLRVGPSGPADTAEYIHARMRRAGVDRDVFTSDGIAMIHEASIGSLREIDRIAAGSLRFAARRKKKLVERDIIAHVIEHDAPGRGEDHEAR